MNDSNKKPTSFTEHLNQQHGKPGSEERMIYEKGLETSKREVVSDKPRKKRSHSKKSS